VISIQSTHLHFSLPYFYFLLDFIIVCIQKIPSPNHPVNLTVCDNRLSKHIDTSAKELK